MNRTLGLACCLLALAAVPLLADQPAPAAARPTVVAAGDCAAPQLDLAAVLAAPLRSQAPAAPGEAPVTLLPLTHFVCCTQADRQACTAECAPCQGFTHCAAAECLCDCFCG